MDQVRWLDERESRAWRALESLRTPLEAVLNRQLSHDSSLSTADYAVLVALSEAPGRRLRARALVGTLKWEKSRLSHQIRRMEQRGLVTREGCATDGRGAYVALAPAGVQAIEAAAPGHVSAVRRVVIDALSPAQLDQLAEIGEAIGARLVAEGCTAAELAGDPSSADDDADSVDTDGADDTDGAIDSDGDDLRGALLDAPPGVARRR